MLKFNEFLKEEFDEVLPVDEKYLESNIDTINTELDKLTSKPYQNAPIFLTQLRGALERFSVLLPQEATKNFLNLGAELAYKLGELNQYLYIIFDTNEDGFVDGYAQIVSSEELEDLFDMDSNEVLNSDREPITMRPSTWYARRDDDSGNSDQY
jgi:hypothetical protein